MSISEAIQQSAIFNGKSPWIAPNIAKELGVGEAIISQTISGMMERELIERVGSKRVNGVQGQPPKHYGLYRKRGPQRFLNKPLVNWWPEQDGIDAKVWAR